MNPTRPHTATAATGAASTVLTGWTVLFDWNGTLVDDLPRSHLAACAVLESRGMPTIPLTQFRDRFRLPLSALFADLGVPHRVCAAAEAQWNALITGLPVTLRTGALDMLTVLAHYGAASGVISAAATEAVTPDLHATGTGDLFNVVVGGIADKAVALRWFTAHRSAHRSSPRVAYVGDPEHDMSSARRTGALVIGITGGYRPAQALREAGAQHLITDLIQIPELLSATETSRPAPVTRS
ncbi:HAD family hydrolase [Frankia sp. Mgl5]|uniref:HAD family hydrolase n=1 Tax=Frankia sp. Mgl5 TaxID=2933793 RepID=UPI00200DF7F1|nr:HAD family hydrolase [Frankia sp. Mgl5]MCK9929884.1 HAD family hydrolase [Frankia sp. Mgl5]